MGQCCCKSSFESTKEDIQAQSGQDGISYGNLINIDTQVGGNHTHRDIHAPGHKSLVQQPGHKVLAQQPTHSDVCLPIVVAMHSFCARGPSELTFEKGDSMEVHDDSDTDWWFVQHMVTKEKGYVPVPYIASSSSLESQDWYFGNISRVQAEQLLLSKINTNGAFLLRSSESGHGFTLSIRTVRETSTHPRIKHYRVNITENMRYYISKSKVFQTLNDLIDFYHSNKETELFKIMRQPCRKPPPEMNDISKDTKDKWEIERSSIQLVKKLGEGSFGKVWLGTWNNNVNVAIKMLKEGSMSVKAFLEEAQTMKELRHPNILVLYAVCTKEEPILIITEYMEEGSLLDFLRSNSGHNLTCEQQIFIASQVSAGMAYLELRQYIHRDLAARNVLVGLSLNCKVADFGLARICLDDEYHSTGTKFPVKWTAPEAISYNNFSIKSDVWSFGILLMEIITKGAVPYPGMSKQEVVEGVQRGLRMGKPLNCPDALYELMHKCWSGDPNNRPSFAYIQDFLENYNVQSENSYYAQQNNTDS